MVYAPQSSHRPDFDKNARAYLDSLQSGVKPDIRPAFGKWERAVRRAENGFNMGVQVAKLLRNLSDDKKKYPGLAELLYGPAFTPGTGTTAQAKPRLTLVEPDIISSCPPLPAYAQIPAEASAGASTELDWYEEYSRVASDRAFDGFHAFCGLWLFSTIAGRRVYSQVKAKKFYTNMSLALCAETSLSAKSFTANVAKNLLYDMHLEHLLTPNKITPQRLLSEMAGKWIPEDFEQMDDEQKERLAREYAMPAQKGMVFDELGKFIQGALRKTSTNTEFIDLLLELDASPAKFKTSTITRGSEEIMQPYLSLLGSMTPTNLKDIAKAGADGWSDGWWARVSFVVAPPPDPDEEDPGPPRASGISELPRPHQLLQSLRDWHERLGIPACTIVPGEIADGEKKPGKPRIDREDLSETKCTMDLDVEQSWLNYEHAMRRLITKLPNADFNGSYVRLAETAMRIATLLASLSNENHIEMRHWAKAQELTEILRGYLHSLYAQVNPPAEQPSTVVSTIETKIKATVEKLCNQGKPPSIRDLCWALGARNDGKGIDSGTIKATVANLERTNQLKKAKVGKTERYELDLEDQD